MGLDIKAQNHVLVRCLAAFKLQCFSSSSYVFYYFLISQGCIVQDDKENSTLKPVILEEITASHCQKIRELVHGEKYHPQDYAKFYDKYSDLVNKQVRR